jgi:hypothetical protein
MDKPLEKASCDVRGEGVFDLDQQRFQAPEILFQPALCGRWAAHGAVPFSVPNAESEKVQKLVFASRGVQLQCREQEDSEAGNGSSGSNASMQKAKRLRSWYLICVEYQRLQSLEGRLVRNLGLTWSFDMV